MLPLTHFRPRWSAIASALLVVVAIVVAVLASVPKPQATLYPGYERKLRAHFDHTPIMPDSFDSPQAVTRMCLECHPDATHVMKTSHFQWLGPETSTLSDLGPRFNHA